MAGVGFQDEPDLLAGRECERMDCARGEMSGAARAAIDFRFHVRTTLFQRGKRSSDNVARAESARVFGGEKDIARADGQSGVLAGRKRAERNFQSAI